MIRLLVVDGSALARKWIKATFAADAGIEMVGLAMNAAIAWRKIELLAPGVITLDVGLLQRDGSDFLRELMQRRPLPVVLLSNLAQAGAQITLEALSLGAVDCIPRHDTEVADTRAVAEFAERVRAAAHARPLASGAPAGADGGSPQVRPAAAATSEIAIITIGTSTGGTEAIRDVNCALPEDTPGIVISQHIPGSFSRAFADRLNQNTAITVCEASDGQPILPGHAYLAPGGRHLRVRRNGSGFRCQLDDSPEVNRHRPSVDVVFSSVAETAGARVIGVLLTGMGDDGSESPGLMKAAGAITIAQDEASSVVWGMPGEAVRRGHASLVLPLGKIAEKILRSISRGG